MRQELQLSLAELAAAAEVELRAGSDSARIGAVCTDTRALQRGDLFVALSGARFDGHEFLGRAAAAGAGALLVTKAAVEKRPELLTQAGDLPLLLADDTRLALGRLARWHRRRCDVVVVAITGSNGKTTTKELLAAALTSAGSTHRTPGNFNNELGLPFSMLGLRPEHRFAVLEMGMNHPGEIRYLARLAEPEVGLVTNVAAAHTEGLGSIEGVARAKGELFEELSPDAIAVVALDDPWVAAQADRAQSRRLTFGTAAQADLRIVELAGGTEGAATARCVVRYGDHQVTATLPLPGVHNARNGAAALAVCAALGLDLEAAGAAMARMQPAAHRSTVVQVGDLVLLDDCYNANPASCVAALGALAELAAGARGRPVAVLGEMLELGEQSAAQHERVGREAAQRGCELLVTVGDGARPLGTAARDAGVTEWVHCDHSTDVAEVLAQRARPGDHVLLKGSRRVGLERVLADLRDEEGR